ncbi:MAG: transposase [Myxococcales bacterium]|nr:MAG: transposase [Myxococcales bacterium]
MIHPADESLIRRERVLQLADELGNVRDVCRAERVSRSQYYAWKRRYDAQGREGLRDRRSCKPRSIEQIVIGHAVIHPMWGCHRLARYLKDTLDVTIPGPKIQDILNRHGLGYREDRAYMVEKLAGEGKIQPPRRLIEEVAHLRPRFLEFGKIGASIGELLVQDMAVVGDFLRLGRLYVQVVVETHSCYTWAHLHVGRTAEAAVEALRSEVLPFFERRGWLPDAIRTPRDPWYYAPKRKDEPLHPYRAELKYLRMVHKLIPSSIRNGLVTSFLDEVRAQIFRPVLFDGVERDLGEMQETLDRWLDDYNRRPLDGFPTDGQSPASFWPKLPYE